MRKYFRLTHVITAIICRRELCNIFFFLKTGDWHSQTSCRYNFYSVYSIKMSKIFICVTQKEGKN